MECKFKKNTICDEEILWNADSQIRVETEFKLPDSLGTVGKLLSATVTPVITSKNKAGEALSVDGIASVKIVYTDDRDLLETYDTSFVFTKNIEFPFSLEDTVIKTIVSVDKQNVRAVNGRTLAISLDMLLKTVITKCNLNEYISPDDNDNFEYKTETVTVCKKNLYAEKNIIIDEEIELSEVHAPIGKILHYTYKVILDECKIMNNKVMLKGALSLCVFYLSDDGYTPCRFEHKIPYSQVCDIDGIDDTFICKTETDGVYIELKCRSGGYDDQHTILLNGKIMLSVSAKQMAEATVICDMYSYESDISLKENIISLSRVCQNISDSFTARKSIQFSDGSVGQIVYITSGSVVNHSKIADGMLNLFGTIYIKMLILSAKGMAEYFERGVDFEYNCKINCTDEYLSCTPIINVTNTSYIIKSESEIEVICELSVMGDVHTGRAHKIISSAELQEADGSSPSEYAVYICSLEENEEVWNVAKRYRKRLGDICRRNGIENGTKTVCGKLII